MEAKLARVQEIGSLSATSSSTPCSNNENGTFLVVAYYLLINHHRSILTGEAQPRSGTDILTAGKKNIVVIKQTAVLNIKQQFPGYFVFDKLGELTTERRMLHRVPG